MPAMPPGPASANREAGLKEEPRAIDEGWVLEPLPAVGPRSEGALADLSINALGWNPRVAGRAAR